MTTPNRSQTNGVLPVAAGQTYGNGSRHTSTRAPSQKLKAIVRKLAPGLTESEFLAIVGDEWKLGQGKVDWFQYKPGKVSKDPSKPSRPSRAYFHLLNEAHVLSLSDAVRQSTFEDALNTFNSPCLIGPPVLEFATYGRTPGGRVRQDARAGTIDQDPEFMAFLEGLANPITTKDTSGDSSNETPSKTEKVITTPLVQFLKDKKANKTKEAAAKAAKKQESQAKAKSSKEASNAAEDSKKKGKDGKMDKVSEKASRDAVRILNREAATKGSTTTTEASGSASAAVPKLDVGKAAGRQRGTIVAAHIRMLQRDLGLTPAQAHRQVKRDAADAQKAEREAAAEKTAAGPSQAAPTQTAQSQPVPTAPRASQANGRKPRARVAARAEANKFPATANSPSTSTAGPSTPIVLLKKKPENLPPPSPTTPSAAPPPRPTQNAASNRKPALQVAAPSAGATQAFVKHANPSQGVTEALLKEAMENFGAVSTVEIDKRKGFAYVDFVDAEGLKKAMAANPISVAQGTVQVMQRKGTSLPPEKKPVHPAPHPHLMTRGGRGGRGGSIGRRGGGRGGRGGNNASATASTEQAKAPASAPTGPAAK